MMSSVWLWSKLFSNPGGSASSFDALTVTDRDLKNDGKDTILENVTPEQNTKS